MRSPLRSSVLALGVSAGSRVVTGNEVAVVALTIAWMSAAITRLGELRRGERPALQLRNLNVRTAAILIAGTLPWILLGFLQRAYPASSGAAASASCCRCPSWPLVCSCEMGSP